MKPIFFAVCAIIRLPLKSVRVSLTSRDRGTRPTTIINVEWQAGVATILHMRANGVQSKSNGPSYQMPNPLMGDAVLVILVLVVILVVILMLSFALMLIMRHSSALHWCHSFAFLGYKEPLVIIF